LSELESSPALPLSAIGASNTSAAGQTVAAAAKAVVTAMRQILSMNLKPRFDNLTTPDPLQRPFQDSHTENLTTPDTLHFKGFEKPGSRCSRF